MNPPSNNPPPLSVNAAFIYILTLSNQLTHIQTLHTDGNALSLTLSHVTPISPFDSNPPTTRGLSLIISVDRIHKPGSMNIIQDTNSLANTGLPPSSLHFYKLMSMKFLQLHPEGFESEVSEESPNEEQLAKLGGVLYNMGNLRKMEDEE